MSMAKGLLPDTHAQSAGAARSTVLKDADVVMLIGARLNWLLSHGKGKTWGDAPKKFIQIDIEPKEMDSNVEIVAPVVGDIGSCVSALLAGMGGSWSAAPADWLSTVSKKRDENVAKMAPKLMSNASPMDYHGALGVLRTIVKERPDAIFVNEGANTLDLARGVIDMYKPRKRIDVGTWGVMGIDHGVRQGLALRQDDGSLRRRRHQRHLPRRTEARRQRRDGFRQADAHQCGDRPGGRLRERPHRQPQPAKRSEKEVTDFNPFHPAHAG
jgi:thiamine pyrophosphate-dependent acetolactate synthase large subunit-like protein